MSNKITEFCSNQFLRSPLKRKGELSIDPHRFIHNHYCFYPTETKRLRRSFLIDEAPKNYIELLPGDLRASAQAIENYLKENCVDLDYIHLVRSQIIRIAGNNATSQRQQAELGLLFYAIVTGKPIVADTDLIEVRIDEIHGEYSRLIFQHQRIKDKTLRRLFPSGRINYLLRCFARMIFPAEGILNVGGCFAVIELLNSSLTNLITEEIRQQILAVTERLIDNCEFRSLFTESFEVHESLRQILLIDLKRPPTEQICFLYVQWDLFFALSLHMAQYDEANCYAHAIFSNLLTMEMDAVLKILIDLLKKGHLEIEGVELPLELLLISRRYYFAEFDQELTESQARDLVGFSVADLLLSPDTKEMTMGTRSLELIIQDYFGDQAEYAKQIILSHKRNFLQQALFVALQFFGSNSGLSSLSAFKTAKTNLIGYLHWDFMLYFLNKLPPEIKEDGDFKQFINDFMKTLFDRFFLVNFEGGKLSLKNNYIFFDHHTQGLHFDGDEDHYDECQKISRLLYVYEDQYLFIDRLSNFGDCLLEIVEDLSSPAHSPLAKRGQEKLQRFIQKDIFKELISKMIKKWNQNATTLEADIYHSSDSFFLLQKGGVAQATINWGPIRSLYLDPITIEHSSNVPTLFSNICNQLEAYRLFNPAFADQKLSKIYATSFDHSFNLTPHRFKAYWNRPEALLESVVQSGQEFWQQPITQEEQRGVLIQIYKEQKVEEILSMLPDEPIPLCVFRQLVSSGLDKEGLRGLDRALEMMMERIHLEAIGYNLCSILAKVGIRMDEFDYQIIKVALDKNRGRRVFTPYKLAKILNKVLMQIKAPQFIPSFILEDLIREEYGFQKIFEIGDLNWSEDFTEKITRSQLILRYDIDQKELIFCERYAGIIRYRAPKFSTAFLRKFRLFFPTAL